jgi:hypothetical protein
MTIETDDDDLPTNQMPRKGPTGFLDKGGNKKGALNLPRHPNYMRQPRVKGKDCRDRRLGSHEIKMTNPEGKRKNTLRQYSRSRLSLNIASA